MNRKSVDPTWTPDLDAVMDKCQGLFEMEFENDFFLEHLSGAHRQLRHLKMEYDKLKKFKDKIVRDGLELAKHEHTSL